MTKTQIKIVTGCTAAYFGAYVCRLNMAAVMPAVAKTFDLNGTQTGFIFTAFSIVYALGQLLNGSLSEKIPPVLHISIGLAGTVLCNFLVSIAGCYEVLLISWLANGCVQSMLWTPMVRLMAGRFDETAKRKASFLLSGTMLLGHLLVWGGVGALAESVSWRMLFRLSALSTLLISILALMFLFRTDADMHAVHCSEKKEKIPILSIIKGNFSLVLILCIINGFVRDGIFNWTPTILDTNNGVDMLIVPAISLAGLYLGNMLLKNVSGNMMRALQYTFSFCILFLAVLLVPRLPSSMTALLLGIEYAAMIAINPILTTLIPMAQPRAVGFCAGLADSMIYAGSSVAGVAVGALGQSDNWSNAYCAWLCAIILGWILCLLIRKKRMVR